MTTLQVQENVHGFAEVSHLHKDNQDNVYEHTHRPSVHGATGAPFLGHVVTPAANIRAGRDAIKKDASA